MRVESDDKLNADENTSINEGDILSINSSLIYFLLI